MCVIVCVNTNVHDGDEDNSIAFLDQNECYYTLVRKKIELTNDSDPTSCTRRKREMRIHVIAGLDVAWCLCICMCVCMTYHVVLRHRIS